MQRIQVIIVEITHHPDAVPRRHPRRRAIGPVPQIARVVAICAVDAQRLAEMNHQRIGPFRLLDGGEIAGRQRGLALHANVLGLLQERRERIIGQRGVVDQRGGMRHAGGCLGQSASRFRPRIVEPDILRHRIAAMAGVARNADILHMALPVAVDILRHLQHAAGDDLGVIGIIGHVGDVVAIGAALFRRHPIGDGDHQPGKLPHTEIAQHLHVLVGHSGFHAGGARGRQARRHLGPHLQRRENVGIVDLIHRGATKAALHANDRRVFHAEQHIDRQQRARGDADQGGAIGQALGDIVAHFGAPGRVAGSITVPHVGG